MSKILPILFAILLIPNAAQADLVSMWSFDTAGDTEGWSANPAANITGLTTNATGALEGTASGNDPQLRQALAQAWSAGATAWDRVEFRIRETVDATEAGGTATALTTFSPVGLIVQLKDGANPTATFNSGITAVSSGDDFFTVTVDISSFGSSAFDVFRLDPIGGASANSNSQTDLNGFEVDFVSLYDNAIAIPEPSSIAVIGFGCICLAARRRKAIAA